MSYSHSTYPSSYPPAPGYYNPVSNSGPSSTVSDNASSLPSTMTASESKQAHTTSGPTTATNGHRKRPRSSKHSSSSRSSSRSRSRTPPPIRSSRSSNSSSRSHSNSRSRSHSHSRSPNRRIRSSSSRQRTRNSRSPSRSRSLGGRTIARSGRNESRHSRHASHRERERERDQERSRDRERERERERDRDRDRDGRSDRDRNRERDADAAQPTAHERSRSSFTVFCSQIHPRVKERDLFEFFSHVGKVEDIRLITDSKTGKSKGMCYVEFGSETTVPKACALSGQLLDSYPITIAPIYTPGSQTASTGASLAALTHIQPSTLGYPYPPTSLPTLSTSLTHRPSAIPIITSPYIPLSPDSMRIYVGSLHYSVSESDLRPIFESFGAVESIDLHRDPATGQSKGFAFVQYQKSADAKMAMAALDGIEVAGRPIKVGNAAPPSKSGVKVATTTTLPITSTVGVTAPVMLATSIAPISPNAQPTLTVSTTTPIVSTATSLIPPPPTSTPVTLPPTRCLLIRNMFTPSEETDPNFDVEIKEELEIEANKFGVLNHIYVDKINSEGRVWLKFEAVEAAILARQTFDKRYFSGKQLQAEFIPETVYTQQFTEANDSSTQ